MRPSVLVSSLSALMSVALRLARRVLRELRRIVAVRSNANRESSATTRCPSSCETKSSKPTITPAGSAVEETFLFMFITSYIAAKAESTDAIT